MTKLHRAFCLQVLSLLLALTAGVWLYRSYPVLQYLAQARTQIAALGPEAAILYPLLYAACNIFLIPAGAVAVGSGLFFGLWKGAFMNIAGNTLAMAVSFTFSRWLGRRWIRERFLRRPKWSALDQAVGREGWKIIFLSQVIPFAPCSLLNYLFGVTRIRFRTALLWTALAQAPTMFLYAYAGSLAQIGIGFLEKGHQLTPVEYSVWVGGFMVALAATWALARLAGRLLDEAKAKAARDQARDLPQISPPTRLLPAEQSPVRKPAMAKQAF